MCGVSFSLHGTTPALGKWNPIAHRAMIVGYSLSWFVAGTLISNLALLVELLLTICMVSGMLIAHGTVVDICEWNTNRALVTKVEY